MTPASPIASHVAPGSGGSITAIVYILTTIIRYEQSTFIHALREQASEAASGSGQVNYFA